MLKIRALNRESSSDEEAPGIRREAQEEIALDMYNKALKLQCNEEYTEAEEVLQKLIDENIPQLENEGGLPKTMSTLKYSCYSNLGNIAMKKNECQKALDNYTTASELDKKDVTLWYKIGKLALKLDKYRYAAYAFYMGLECNESHWPCLDELITVLYATRDNVNCLCYITKALILDPTYTKGLVFRKKIYESNPATRDYYKLYNRDYVLEPSLDAPINEEDEEFILNEAQVLFDRITDVEKSLEVKPLQVIPLPVPLEDFSWVALGKTVTGLHKYISDNNMSHFTFIDLKRCMSNNIKSVILQDEDINMEVDPSSEIVETNPENKSEAVPEAANTDAQNSEPLEDGVVERRMSQTSENNFDGQETNVNQVQTDDNEEMEQENDDQEEQIEVRTDKSRPQNRSSKRKRDLLSDLQIWGWHSKRKYAKKSKTEKDFTIEDALCRIIPSHLLPNGISEEKYNPCEDSMNTMEIYRLHVEDHMTSMPSPEYSPKSVDGGNLYFGTDLEKEDVQKFWTQKWICCDAVNLVKEFVFALAVRWKVQWPKELVFLYIEAYNMFREHCNHPPLYGRSDITFDMHRIDALATILYGELTTFDSNPIKFKEDKENPNKIHCTSVVHLQFLSAWGNKWEAEHSEFFIRVHWLRTHLHRMEGQTSLSICALQLVQEELETHSNQPRYRVVLPNCYKYSIVHMKIVEALLKNLEMVESLSRLEELYNAQKYADVGNILKATFVTSANHVTCKRMGRPAQLGMLIHSLWYTDITECFIWCEECLYESVENYIRPKKDHDKWEAMVDKCLQCMYEIIKSETVCVVDHIPEEKRIRLVGSLSRICCKQLNMENTTTIPLGTVLPWILLHYVLLREEHRAQARKRVSHIKKDDDKTSDRFIKLPSEEEVPPSVAILFSGHEFLGPRGWCLTGQGQLLHFIVDTVLDRLDTPIFEHLRDKLDIHLEQAFFCLYQHPSKKNKISRHLADHNVNPLPLTWERAQQIYEFFCPCALPEFDSYKSISISSELEQLLQRITSLVPSECDPLPLIPKIVDFMNGNSDTVPDPIEFAPKTRSMYYLLGDFYFKQSEVKKSTKYFQLDLCINPWRLDSWACMALGTASQLEQKLTYCERFKNENEFLDKANSAKICFQQALSLANDHVTLWIEYGSFEYMVHSYCSRLLKYESENFSMERFEELEGKKESYLHSSEKSFLRALELYNADQSEADERWLYHYMLAKISEKSQKEPIEFLQHYLTAAALLQENNATYPDKINYNNPPHLAVEALEVLYRINASILKYLELHEGKDIASSVGKMFKKCLDSCSFPKHGESKKTAENKAEKSDKRAEETPVENKNEVSSEAQKEAEVPKDPEAQKMAEVQKETDLQKESTAQKEPETFEVPDDVKKCVEDLVVQLEEKEKEKAREVPMDVAPPKESEVKEEIKLEDKKEELDDIIVLSDSDEDVIIEQERDPLDISPIAIGEENIKNVQEIMDQMMKETMNNKDDASTDMETEVLTAPEEVKPILPEEKPEAADQSVKMEVDPEQDVEGSGATNVEEAKMESAQEVVVKDDDDTKKGSESDTRKSTEDSTSSSSSSSDSSSSDSDSDDSSSTSSSSSSDVSTGNLSDTEVLNLVDRCIVGLEQCIRRLPQNYKAIYRLAHLYFHYNKKKDLTKSKQLFLSEYKCKTNAIVTGLFSDRKTNNFFNGVWRIPSSEIDRPGSLSAHMSRCVTLLLQILRATNDHKTLLDLCLQLKRIPDADKVYIRNSEREQLSEQALSLCVQSLKGLVKNATPTACNKLLGDIFKAYQRSQKNLTHKESVFAGMLSDIYKKLMGDKLPENANILDLAVKYCQQNRAAEKLKRQQSQNVLPKAPLVTTSNPVLPTPTTQAPNLPLKRPTLGRPRGRPPGPRKDPTGQTRSPRGRSPMAAASNPFWTPPMYDTKTAYDYLRQYQEHVIRQYNQTLSLTQLAQLIQTQFNPTTTTNSMMNPTALLQTMQQLSSVTANQFAQSLSMLNPTLLKKLSDQMALTNLATPNTTQIPQLSAEQIRQITALMQTTKPSSSKISSTITTLGQSSKGGSSKSSLTYTQATSSKTTTTGSFKTPTSELAKIRAKEPSKTASSIQTIKDLQIIPTNSQTVAHQDLEKAALLMKERPNISITPVTQSSNSNQISTKPASVIQTSPPKFTTVLTSTKTSDINTSFLKSSPIVSAIPTKPTNHHSSQLSKHSAVAASMSKPLSSSVLPSPPPLNLPKPLNITPTISKSSPSIPRSSPTLNPMPPKAHSSSTPTLPKTVNAIEIIASKASSPASVQPKPSPAHTLSKLNPLPMLPKANVTSTHSKSNPVSTLSKPSSSLTKSSTVTSLPKSNPSVSMSKSTPTAHSKSSTPTSVFTKAAMMNPMPPNPLCPPKSSSPTKTLQEKLADKQKQASVKNLTTNFEFGGDKTIHGDFYKNLGARNMPSSLSVIPNFPSDSSLSVTQVTTPSSKVKALEVPAINIFRVGEQMSNVTKPPELLSSSGIDLSSRSSQTLSKKPTEKPERKQSSDDDVILIE